MNTFPRLQSLIADHLGIDEYEITRDASIADDLGADSLDFIELVNCQP